MKLTSHMIGAVVAGMAAIGFAGQALALDFNFNTYLNNAVDTQGGNHSLLLTGVFQTNGSTITGISNAVLTDSFAGNPPGPFSVTFLATGVGGSNDFGSVGVVSGKNSITGLSFQIISYSPVGSPPAFTNLPWTFDCLNGGATAQNACVVTTPGAQLRYTNYDPRTPIPLGGGGTAFLQYSEVPEIDGGTLPKALLLLGAALLYVVRSASVRSEADLA